MKLKVGDRVRVKETFTEDDKTLKKGLTGKIIGDKGTVICIEFDEYIDGHDGFMFNSIGVNGYCWYFWKEKQKYFEIIKDKEIKKEDIALKKGDMVTHKDGTIDLLCDDCDRTIKEINSFLCVSDKIIKVERPIKYETIYEAPKEILDKEEKEYLETVLKPFKNEVEFIKKKNTLLNEYIFIKLIEDIIAFPSFTKDTMYKGMEVDKEYTLKELGLFEGE